jgi:hypothetical protein
MLATRRITAVVSHLGLSTRAASTPISKDKFRVVVVGGGTLLLELLDVTWFRALPFLH